MAAAGGRQQETFGEQHADQPCASRAQREPHPQLVPAIGESREDQGREIRTGDHQHQSHGGEQHEEWLLVLPSNAGIAAGAGSGIRWIRKMGLGFWPTRHRGLAPPGEPRSECGRGVGCALARSQPRVHRQPLNVGPPRSAGGLPNQIVAGERKDHLGLLTDLETKERRRRNTDNREWLVFDP